MTPKALGGRGYPPAALVSLKVAEWSTVGRAASSRIWGCSKEIVHNLSAGQKCSNVRSLERLHIGKSLGCWGKSQATKIPPADQRCHMGGCNPQEKDWFENPCERSVGCSRGARASSFYAVCNACKSAYARHRPRWNKTKKKHRHICFPTMLSKDMNGSLRLDFHQENCALLLALESRKRGRFVPSLCL